MFFPWMAFAYIIIKIMSKEKRDCDSKNVGRIQNFPGNWRHPQSVHDVSTDDHVSVVVTAAFGWQCCPLHQYWHHIFLTKGESARNAVLFMASSRNPPSNPNLGWPVKFRPKQTDLFFMCVYVQTCIHANIFFALCFQEACHFEMALLQLSECFYFILYL